MNSPALTFFGLTPYIVESQCHDLLDTASFKCLNVLFVRLSPRFPWPRENCNAIRKARNNDVMIDLTTSMTK